MNVPFRTALIGLTLFTPLATGCAGRTAPFDEMDKAQITVLRLQGPPPPVAPIGAAPGMPMIPGLPPEWQQGVQQGLGQLQQMLPPGLLPPGLIPGQPQPQAPAAPPPMFKGFVIGQQMPLTDEVTREELLDVFGSEDSFTGNRGPCFTPGMGVSIMRPDQPQPIDLLISINCNQTQVDGFRWPYPNNGFSPEAAQKLQGIYQKLFGPVPPSGA